MAAVPAPGIDHVLVRVHAAGLTPLRRATGERTVVARDVAGTIEAFGGGDGEGRFVVGEEVFGLLDDQVRGGTSARPSAIAEHVVVPATSLSARPRTVSFATSAALPLAATSAWTALIEVASLQTRQTIVVEDGTHPAALCAIQIAAQVGADVVAVGTSEEATLLLELGATVVVRPGHAVPRADVTFEPTRAMALLAGAPHPPHAARLAPADRPPRWTPTGVPRPFARHFTSERPEPLLALIADLVDRGGLRPVVDRCFPLDAAGAALRHARLRAGPGTTVVTVP